MPLRRQPFNPHRNSRQRHWRMWLQYVRLKFTHRWHFGGGLTWSEDVAGSLVDKRVQAGMIGTTASSAACFRKRRAPWVFCDSLQSGSAIVCLPMVEYIFHKLFDASDVTRSAASR